MPTQLARAIRTARSAAGPSRLFGSLRGRLVLVTAVLIVTAALMATALLDDAAHRHRASAEQQLEGSARALSLAVEARVAQGQAVLRTLGASPALASGDLKSFETQAHGSLIDSDSWIILFDSQGHALLDTRYPDGPREAIPVNASAVALLKGDLNRTGDQVGDLMWAPGTRRYLVHLDHLVRIKDKPAYDLAMVLLPSALQRLLAPQGLPDGWYASIIDSRGQFVARNIEPERWVGKPAGSVVQRIKNKPAEVFESVALDGVRTLAAYNHSSKTGWTAAVAMPRYEATGDLGPSLQWLSLICAVLLALGGALTLWFMQGVARAVHGLETYAEGLGRGDASEPEPTGLAETDFIAQALGAAAERLKAREQELQRINETLEARVEEATARLVQSQKIEAIGRLTGGVAHDFNNLLTAVIGNLELLRRKLTDERLLQFVANARSAADRGAKLTAQLLAFARKQTLTREAVDVNALIGGMGELLASSLDGETRIELGLDADTPAALADRTQLEMVLLNLVINARDASPGGGVVRIGTARVHIDQSPLRPEEPPVGVFARITVADDGTGMTRDVMERVFEPFFTTKSPGRGSGLGLPQALGVAQQLGGGIRIESEPGKGTRVHVFLPVADAAAGPVDTPRRAVAGGA